MKTLKWTMVAASLMLVAARFSQAEDQSKSQSPLEQAESRLSGILAEDDLVNPKMDHLSKIKNVLDCSTATDEVLRSEGCYDNPSVDTIKMKISGDSIELTGYIRGWWGGIDYGEITVTSKEIAALNYTIEKNVKMGEDGIFVHEQMVVVPSDAPNPRTQKDVNKARLSNQKIAALVIEAFRRRRLQEKTDAMEAIRQAAAQTSKAPVVVTIYPVLK